MFLSLSIAPLAVAPLVSLRPSQMERMRTECASCAWFRLCPIVLPPLWDKRVVGGWGLLPVGDQSAIGGESQGDGGAPMRGGSGPRCPRPAALPITVAIGFPVAVTIPLHRVCAWPASHCCLPGWCVSLEAPVLLVLSQAGSGFKSPCKPV